VGRLTDYRDMSVLVTGASSGIGRLLALRFASEGARVALVARRADRLEALADEIRGGPGDAIALPCDLAESDQIAAATARATERFGGIDLLVNNAGYGRHRRFLDWDPEEIERMMRVNYLGTVRFTRALLPGMVERGRGWLVFVSSVAGRIGVPDETAYVASKFAVTGFASALSLEVEDAGVHVLTVFPGAIRTPFFDDEALERMPPVARRSMVEPELLVDEILKALAKGKRELTWPRHIAMAYAVGAVSPGFLRRQVKARTIDAPSRKTVKDD